MCAKVKQKLVNGVWTVVENTANDDCFARITPDPTGGFSSVSCDVTGCIGTCEKYHEEFTDAGGNIVEVVDECCCEGGGCC